MSEQNYKPFPSFCLGVALVSFVLAFLIACPHEPAKTQLNITVVGQVTDITDGSPVANVEIRLTAQMHKVLRTTETNEGGQYTITYYGKCNRGDIGTTLQVRLGDVPEGYSRESPYSHLLLCVEEIQTFDFRVKSQPL